MNGPLTRWRARRGCTRLCGGRNGSLVSEPWSRSWLAEPDRIAQIMEAAKDPANGLDDETLSGIADQAESWETWSMRVFPHLKADVAPWFHREYAEHVWETTARYTPPPVAPVLFRGGAKSTLSRALALGLGLTGKRKFILVVCATQDAANRAVTDMAGLITENVVKLYPWAASPTVASTLLVKFGVRQSVINVGGRLTVLGVGLIGGTRGLLVDGQRPDVMLLDDLDDTGDSATVIRRKRAYLLESVIPAAAAGGATIMFAQNAIRPDGIMAEVMRQERGGALHGARIIGPVPMLENPTYDDEGRLSGGTPTWPARFTLESINRERDMMTPNVWLRECQHDMNVAVEGALLEAHHQFTTTPMPPIGDLQVTRIGLDPSVKSSKTTDETGIVVSGRMKDGKIVVLEDATCGPETPMKAWIDTVCDLVEKWGADIVVEDNNGGDAWDLLLKQALKARGLSAQVKSETANQTKRGRAMPVAEAVKGARVVKATRALELTHELCTWLPGDKSPNRIDAFVWSVHGWVSGKRLARAPAGPMIGP
jgi:hypothetical protein